MKLGVLFSGGKDSCYALHKASKEHEIACLLSIESANPDSYMFHTPNISLTALQAKAMNIPIIIKKSEGVKEQELKDLRLLIKSAKTKHKIKGIVTGAIASVYQASRIQKICDSLNLWCFNPLWQKNQMELLNEIIKNDFNAIITKVSAYPFDESFLGRKIDPQLIRKLIYYQLKYKINPAGEGGEYETLVLDAPLFKKELLIKESQQEYSNHNGTLIIKNAELKDKEK